MNPDAPKGGEVAFSMIGSYDGFNPFILNGYSAFGLGGAWQPGVGGTQAGAGGGHVWETLLVGSADEVATAYGHLAGAVEMPADPTPSEETDETSSDNAVHGPTFAELPLGPALQRAGRRAALVGLPPDVAVAADLLVQLGRQRVHHRDADPVQPAGHGVGLAVELAACVQRGQHDFDRGALLHRVHVDGDAAAVVTVTDATVGQQRHLDRVAVPRERLVDRVVNDFVDQVVESALPGGADVHARPFADGLQPLKYRD